MDENLTLEHVKNNLRGKLNSKKTPQNLREKKFSL